MCGIAGVVGAQDESQGLSMVETMLQQIQHRGPDSNGSWAKGSFAFGMQRLSIIDLAAGDQPIFAEDGVGIVFNGEIYNFKALRKELSGSGFAFKTNSDTEVILHLYRQKGLKFVNDLQGMFAVCIYDPRIQKVYLFRDRIGVKPLYFYRDKNKFLFGSEIKSILAVTHTRNIDQRSLQRFLAFRFVPSPDTIWADVKKVDPGTFLEIDISTLNTRTQRYWDITFAASKRELHRNYLAEFEDLFLSAVEKRLLAADVPVGILLSGGLDSSLVAASAKKLGHKNFHTFSIGFQDGYPFNELKFARELSTHIGSNHHEITIGQKEFLDFFDEFAFYSDEPIADLASIPLYYVCKLARQDVKVVLAGEGADEIFGGYNLESMVRQYSILTHVQRLPKFILSRSSYQSLRFLSNRSALDYLHATSPYISRAWTDREIEAISRDEEGFSSSDNIRSWYQQTGSKDILDNVLQSYFKQWLVEDLLMKADKMSMATSIELRVPFLDHLLVEWAAKLPTSLKVGSFLRGFESKKIMRLYAKKQIPQSIIKRPKQGFPVPAYKWLEDDLKEWAHDRLATSPLRSYLDMDVLRDSLAQKKQTNQKSWGQCYWNILTLDSWMRTWV